MTIGPKGRGALEAALGEAFGGAVASPRGLGAGGGADPPHPVADAAKNASALTLAEHDRSRVRLIRGTW